MITAFFLCIVYFEIDSRSKTTMNSPGSVLTLIIDNARVHSQLVAMELDEQSWTYNELLVQRDSFDRTSKHQ